MLHSVFSIRCVSYEVFNMQRNNFILNLLKDAVIFQTIYCEIVRFLIKYKDLEGSVSGLNEIFSGNIPRAKEKK
jgi:hypothetical protein